MSRQHHSPVDWVHVAFYGLIVGAVVVIGALAIWFFIERQSLVVHPEPLPKVTIVTPDAGARTAAAWIRLLTRAELNPTLVALKDFDPIEGVVVFCEVREIPPRLAQLLDEFVRRGGALVFVGMPPRTPIGAFRLEADEGQSEGVIRFTDSASPIHARIMPGSTISVKSAGAALLNETPRMVVDARWSGNERAAVMHMEVDRSRYLWFGFEPDAVDLSDVDLMLMLRSAFRWVAGQPVSEGATGEPQPAKTLAPAARREARLNGFAFSVDRSSDPDLHTIRMINRAGVPLENATVKVWLPPRVTRVALGGDFIMNRGVALTGVAEEGACLVTLRRLARNEDRVIKLRITERKPPQRQALMK